MQKHVIVQKRLLGDLIFYGIIGGILVAMFGWGLWSALEIEKQAVDNQELAAIGRSCRMPDSEGAMTVFVMENGKIKCWRWK